MLKQFWNDDPARAAWQEFLEGFERVKVEKARTQFEQLSSRAQENLIARIKADNLSLDDTMILMNRIKNEIYRCR